MRIEQFPQPNKAPPGWSGAEGARHCQRGLMKRRKTHRSRLVQAAPRHRPPGREAMRRLPRLQTDGPGKIDLRTCRVASGPETASRARSGSDGATVARRNDTAEGQPSRSKSSRSKHAIHDRPARSATPPGPQRGAHRQAGWSQPPRDCASTKRDKTPAHWAQGPANRPAPRQNC